MPTATLDSPLGRLALHEEDGAIVGLTWVDDDERTQDTTPLLSDAVAQLKDYFAGRRQRFDLPLRPAGSAFQRRVYDAMSAIPFGETLSKPAALRAPSAAPAAAIRSRSSFPATASSPAAGAWAVSPAAAGATPNAAC